MKTFYSKSSAVFTLQTGNSSETDNPSHLAPIRKLVSLPTSSCWYCTGHLKLYCRLLDLVTWFIKRSDVSKHSTRNAQALDIPLFRSASGQRTFYYQVVSLWNSLKPKLKLCQSQSEFKQSLKRQLLTKFLS